MLPFMSTRLHTLSFVFHSGAVSISCGSVFPGLLVSFLRVGLDVLYLCIYLCISGGAAGYSCAGWSLHMVPG